MSEEQIQRLIAGVIERLAVRLGADGERGLLVAVFSGATVGFKEAVQQLRHLILQGYRMRLAFSQSATDLYAQSITDQLAGFPHVGSVDPKKWLADLQEAQAVIVPLLSVNTLSKLSLLVADNLATNSVLHALFMGKPVFIARNAAEPQDPGRKELGFHRGTQALNVALLERLRTLAEYGCRLTDIKELCTTVCSALDEAIPAVRKSDALSSVSSRQTLVAAQRVVTAAQVAHAHRVGAMLSLPAECLVTPLARELASRLGVTLIST